MKLLDIKSKAKLEAFQKVVDYFTALGYRIIEIDVRRPWGFYLYFDRDQTKKFIGDFFGDVNLRGIDTSLPLQPKVLVFEPGKRLSWQYHHRRSEIWRCITAECQVVSSPTDKETVPKIIKFGDVINLTAGTRHRAGGIDEWSAVAEIWQHSDPENLSNESDVVRLQDDYGRS